MKKFHRSWGIGLAILVSWLLVPAVHGSSTLTRDQDPLVLTGSDLPTLVGTAVDRVVGFRRDGGSWVQIPVQIDERKYVDFGDVYNAAAIGLGTTAYTDPATHIGPDTDPAFDADDEICFMAPDAGCIAAPSAGHPAGVLTTGGVELQIHDPLDGGLGYVYLFESDGSLSPDAGADYVTYTFDLVAGAYIPNYNTGIGFNPETSFAETPHYRTEFSDRWIRDVVQITAGGATGVDILDRNKPIFAPGVCNRTEETFSNGGGAFFANIDGAVRGIRSYIGANSGPLTERVHRFYAKRQDVRTNLRVHPIQSVATLYDYSPDATGMIYRSSAETSGVLVDGTPDVAATGAIDWEMVTGPQGSLVSAFRFDTDIPGFTWTSYYSDDAATSVVQCTGDASEYATSGPFIDRNIPNTDPRRGAANILVLERIVTYDPPGLTLADAELRRDRAQTPLGVDVFDFDPVAGGVTILLTPQSTTAPPGGSLFYDVQVENTGSSDRTVDIWIDILLPDGSPHPANPVIGPKTKTLRAGLNVTRTVRLRIPSSTPPSGPYTLRGSIGAFPDGPEDQSSFEYTVVAP